MKLADLAVRVRAIERAITESCCRVESASWGAFVSNAEFPQVHMANCAWVDQWPEGYEVADFVDDVVEQYDRLGIGHATIFFTDPYLAFRLQERFAALGFTPESHLAMVHLRRPDRSRADGVDVREARDDAEREACWSLAAQELGESSYPAEASRQILAFSRRRYAALGVRLFLATIHGRAVGYGSLWQREATGYIGDLYTPPEERKRGVGSTIVLDLLEASLAAGNSFTGLTTAGTNTAQVMYRKLGFIAVGERRGFERDLVIGSD